MRILRRDVFTFFILSVCLIALFASALFGLRGRYLKDQDEQLAAHARAEARSLENLLEPAIAAAYSFGALLERSDNQHDLAEFAQMVMQRWPIVARIVIAPGGVVTTVFPEGSADKTIGLNLLQDPVRGSDARRAVETRSLTMTGPYELKEGGIGITARFPVFRHDEKGVERFWGFTVAVVYLDKLLDMSGLRELEGNGYRWALSSVPISPRSGRSAAQADRSPIAFPYLYMHQVFAASRDALPAFPRITEVSLPNSTWLLAIAPTKGRRIGLDFLLTSIVSTVAGVTLAAFVLAFLTRTRRLAALATALSAEVAERKGTEEKLRASVAEKELLLREIHHRVKNNLSIVESIISLQSGEARGTRFEEVFNQLSKRVHSITLIHEKLYRGRDLDHIQAQTYLRDLVHFIVDSIGTSLERPKIEVDELSLTSKAALSVGLILTELCTNAFKYGTGGVVVMLVRRGDSLELSVANEGPPPPANYREGGGLGLRLVEALSGQLDGSWQIEAGPPVRFVITFPSSSALAPAPTA